MTSFDIDLLSFCTTHLTNVEFDVVTDPWRLFAILQEIHDGFLVVPNSIRDDSTFGALLNNCALLNGTFRSLTRHNSLDSALDQILKLHGPFRHVLNTNGTQARIAEARSRILDACKLNLIAHANLATRVQDFREVEE